jgi:hypothetical protein
MHPKCARIAKQVAKGQFNEKELYERNYHGYCLRDDCAFGVRTDKEDEGPTNDRATTGSGHGDCHKICCWDGQEI